MAYSKKQKAIQRAIIEEGRAMGMPRKAILSALATGAVEANFSEPGEADSDRDSAGWRQERRSSYPGKNRMNERAAARRYYQEWKADAPKKGPIGPMAQAVQQSAFPERYQEYADDAADILKAFNKGGGYKRGGRKGRKGRPGSTVTSATKVPGIDNSGLRQQLLQQYVLERDDPSALASLGFALQDAKDVPGSTLTSTDRIPGQRGRPNRRKRGKAASLPSGLGTPQKDGWNGSKAVGAPLAQLAQKIGLQAVSEKRGTTNTASGGVSDHYEGNKEAYAWDLSNGGSPTPEMDKAAMLIARRLGAGKTWKKMGKAGVLNVNKTIKGRTYRFQMLYRTQVGGNHDNHVHFGVRRV